MERKRMSIDNLVPERFGPLQGVRIISSGTLIAQPWAAELAAEMGAEVIQIERPGVGDIGWRTLGIRLETADGSPPVATNWIQERRNIFCVSLDLSKPQGRDLFLKLAARADIWMESSKPGTYPRFGLDDEAVFKVNPKLVITHVSGYGQSGHHDYIHRASYDIVGQAFGGMMCADRLSRPRPAHPRRPLDRRLYHGAVYLVVIAGRTDLCAQHRQGSGDRPGAVRGDPSHPGRHHDGVFRKGVVRERSGNRAQGFQPLDTFAARDGWVVIGAVADVYKRLCRVIGLDPEDAEMAKRAGQSRIDRGDRVRRDFARMGQRAHHR